MLLNPKRLSPQKHKLVDGQSQYALQLVWGLDHKGPSNTVGERRQSVLQLTLRNGLQIGHGRYVRLQLLTQTSCNDVCNDGFAQVRETMFWDQF